MIVSDTLNQVNSAMRIPFVSITLPNRGVPTIDQIYRDNLRLLIAEAGTQDKLAERIKKQPAQISQWLNGSLDSKTGKPRAMSRATAREIERSCGKPEGWMDQPRNPANDESGPKGSVFHELTDEEWEFLTDFRQMPDPDRERYRREIAARAQVMRDFLAQHMARAGLPVPKAAAARSQGVARSVIEAGQLGPPVKDLFDPGR